MIAASYVHLNLFSETLIKPIKYQTELEKPFVLFCGRILNMDAFTEARLVKNLRSHRVLGGICADVTHCKSGLWNCIDRECFVPEKEQLPYSKEQVAEWSEKSKVFSKDMQISNNFNDISRTFGKIVEILEKGQYNRR